MATIDIELICRSSSEYLTQVFTGFGGLESQGLIKLRLTRANNYVPGVKVQPRLRAIVNGEIKVVYDLRDIDELYPDDLAWSDYYFKRSYSPSLVSTLNTSTRIIPYGFNYPVYGDNDYAWKRVLWSIMSLVEHHKLNDIKQTLEQTLRASTILSRITNRDNCRNNCSIHNFEDRPRQGSDQSINYFTRLWDPANVIDIYKEDCNNVNNMRIGCVRALRREFGERYNGGLQANPYTLRVARDLIVDEKLTAKANYLKLTRQAGICITTLGVVGSNGWRIGEFIAGAKAIVCEKLRYPVPGDFLPGKNYLEFTTPEECVAQVKILMDDPALRFHLMQNNSLYYHAYLRPDKLIWNTLHAVLA